MIGWWRRIRGQADDRVVRHCSGGCGRRACYSPDFRMVRYRCVRCRRRARADKKGESASFRLRGGLPLNRLARVVVIAVTTGTPIVVGGVVIGMGANWRLPVESPGYVTLIGFSIVSSALGLTAIWYSRALAESRRRQREAATVFDSTAEAVVITDTHGLIQRVNPSFEAIFGYSEREAAGEHFSVFRAPGCNREAEHALRHGLEDAGRWRGEFLGRRLDGHDVPLWLTATAVPDERGRVTQHVIVMLDISELKASEAHLEHMAYHDALTGLPNRRALEIDVQRAIMDTRTGTGLVGVLFIDLDGFKAVNDRLGHAAGDALLKQIAERLPQSIKRRDTAGRLAGDEFLVVLSDIRDRQSTAIVARRIADWITEPMVIAGETLRLTASIGRAVYPDDGSDVETLIHNADAAMYEGKAAAAARGQLAAGGGEQ